MKEILNFLEISIKKSQEFVKSKIIKNTNYVIEISNLNNIENITAEEGILQVVMDGNQVKNLDAFYKSCNEGFQFPIESEFNFKNKLMF